MPSVKAGRPANTAQQEERKQRLINAAYALLGEKSYRSISIREVASRADMQSAMISYYFGDKEGLFVALVESIAERNLSRFQSALTSDNPLKTFIRTALQVFASNQPLLRLVTDEVLVKPSRLRDTFVAALPQKLARILPAILKAQQERGLLRQDLSPKWAAFSLMTMMITPFIGQPIREMAWQITEEDLTSDSWADHLYTLFMHGAACHD